MSPLNIVVGITGGIAAYKAVGVVRALVLAGHDVHVVATEAALRFVGRPTLEAISRNPVHTDLYEGVAEVRHVAIGQARRPHRDRAGDGEHDRQARDRPRRRPARQHDARERGAARHRARDAHRDVAAPGDPVANIATLRARGVTVVGPARRTAHRRRRGPGRMAEPDDIVAAALERAAASGPRDLAGRRVVVTAGGTREPLDPVRFLGNRSSGKQGVAIAEAAARAVPRSR